MWWIYVRVDMRFAFAHMAWLPSRPKKLICVSQMFASPSQSGPALGNLSPLRMSLFAIFSQLRPNIPDHSSAQGRRAADGTHGSITHIIAWRYLLREAAMCVFQIGDEKTLD